MIVDASRPRHEQVRWILLLTLNNARPRGAGAETLVTVVQRSLYPDATVMEVRRELGYLASRRLVEVDEAPDGSWLAKLVHHGIDIAEYTIACEPGIARPPNKYW